MQNDGVRLRVGESELIELKRGENSGALSRFFFLAHRGPDIGVKRIGIFGRFAGIMGDDDPRAGIDCIALGLPQNGRVRLVAFRAGEREVQAQLCREEHQTMGDVVPVAEKGEFQSGECALVLLDRLKVR